MVAWLSYSKKHKLKNNDMNDYDNVTLPRPEGGGKGFYPLSGEGSTERGGDTPRGNRHQGVSPTREVATCEGVKPLPQSERER